MILDEVSHVQVYNFAFSSEEDEEEAEPLDWKQEIEQPDDVDVNAPAEAPVVEQTVDEWLWYLTRNGCDCGKLGTSTLDVCDCRRVIRVRCTFQ